MPEHIARIAFALLIAGCLLAETWFTVKALAKAKNQPTKNRRRCRR